MANWISHDRDSKKHEEMEKPDLRAQGLLGGVRDIHHKINRTKPATVFSEYQTEKAFEDYQREFELQKSKAILHASRLQTRLI